MAFYSNIDKFLTQDNLDEFILVDDFSDAKSGKALNQYTDVGIRVIKAEQDIPGKKNALTTGIHAARHEVVLLSDIDCFPASNKWAELLASKINNGKEIVLGYGAYLKRKGWLNKFIRFESMMTAIQYMSYALAGIPYMGVGRNMAYRKALFERIGGLSNHLSIVSGDDDLFIRDAATKTNVAIAMDPRSFTYSLPAGSLGEYINQKSRHITTSVQYKWLPKMLLFIYAASHICFYLSMIILLLSGYLLYIFKCYVIFNLLLLPIFVSLCKKYDESDLAYSLPVLDLCYFFYFIMLSPYLIFKKRTW